MEFDSLFYLLQVKIEQLTTAKKVNACGKVILISSTALVCLSLQAKQIMGLQVQKPSRHAPLVQNPGL
jgi:hypothetical protein